MTRIWLDADSAPILIRNFIVNFAEKNDAEVFFVANRNISAKKNNYKMIICEKEKDSADNYIFENSKSGDLVITKDLSLASRLLSKEIKVINDKGIIFTRSYIQTHLEEREMNIQLAALGFGEKKASYSEENFKKFRKSFFETVEKLNN